MNQSFPRISPSASSRGRRFTRLGRAIVLFASLFGGTAASAQSEKPAVNSTASGQTAEWSADDMRFFLHGSMSTEVIPENVLKAFRTTYPDLFPGADLTVFGLIADGDELPIGLSRRNVPHLGGLRSIGVNCAACHVADVTPTGGGAAVRIIGVTSHFDNEAFFGSVIVATFRTADPANMRNFLRNYYDACEPAATTATSGALSSELASQGERIAAAIAAQLGEEKSERGDMLLELDAATLTLDDAYLKSKRELAPVARSMLQLFHNMRAALHVPQQPFDKLPPASGPGRNNAFGVLSLALFGEPTVYAPSKFGVAWNLRERSWVHWDGNTRLPIIRNLAASLGLGAPLVGKRGVLDFALVDRHTKLSEQVRAPRYPWKIDAGAAQRGRALFETNCAKCHTATGRDERLFAASEVGTDANRAKLFSPHQAALYNKFFGELEVAGYEHPKEPPLRSTEKYVAPGLAGVWARSPYLHNGSVRTMKELLMPAAQREAKFHRGSRVYDEREMGYTDAGTYLLDTTTEGNSNRGHEYGVELTAEQKAELMEFLKTL